MNFLNSAIQSMNPGGSNASISREFTKEDLMNTLSDRYIAIYRDGDGFRVRSYPDYRSHDFTNIYSNGRVCYRGRVLTFEGYASLPDNSDFFLGTNPKTRDKCAIFKVDPSNELCFIPIYQTDWNTKQMQLHTTVGIKDIDYFELCPIYTVMLRMIVDVAEDSNPIETKDACIYRAKYNDFVVLLEDNNTSSLSIKVIHSVTEKTIMNISYSLYKGFNLESTVSTKIFKYDEEAGLNNFSTVDERTIVGWFNFISNILEQDDYDNSVSVSELPYDVDALLNGIKYAVGQYKPQTFSELKVVIDKMSRLFGSEYFKDVYRKDNKPELPGDAIQ